MTKNNKKGFTIIEVVLVLAIAGLIFLMVFIALPALQRSQRNTRRRQDMARIMSAIIDYQANNGGKSPVTATTTWGNYTGAEIDKDFPARYIEENLDTSSIASYSDGIIGRQVYSIKCQDGKSCDRFMDPDGQIYKIAATGEGITKLDHSSSVIDDFNHIVYIGIGIKCNSMNEDNFEVTGNPNDTVVRYVLEGGSIYCTDNQQ